MSFDLFGDPSQWVTSTTTVASSAIKGNRAPEDHLEVRCAWSNTLLGWITGINAKAVPDTEELVFKGDDDAMVVEDEDGTVSSFGMDTLISVAGFQAAFEGAELEDLKLIHAHVPSYARRRRFITGEGVKTVVYEWTAAIVELHEAMDLFDFDNFVPYGVADEKLIWEDSQFHRRSLLKPATIASMPKAVNLVLNQPLTGSQLAGTSLSASDFAKAMGPFSARSRSR